MRNKTKPVKSEIVLGSLIYGSENPELESTIGSIIKKTDEGKYVIEWYRKDCGDEPNTTEESEIFVRAGLFSMKVYREAMGEFLPEYVPSSHN